MQLLPAYLMRGAIGTGWQAGIAAQEQVLHERLLPKPPLKGRRATVLGGEVHRF